MRSNTKKGTRKVRIPLAGMPNQRNLDSLQSLIDGKDQSFKGGIVIPVTNPLTNKSTVYFEKRPGFETHSTPANGCGGDAIFFSRSANKTITAFCDNDIYVTDSAGTSTSVGSTEDGTTYYAAKWNNSSNLITVTLGSGDTAWRDFTVEYFAKNNTNKVLIYMGEGDAGYVYNGPTQGYQGYGGTTLNFATFTGNIATQYVHHAICRQGGTIRAFVDGGLEDSDTYSTTISTSTVELARYTPSDTLYYGGSMALLRITKAARYTDTFTPPTAPYPTGGSDPYWNQTILLMNFNGNFNEETGRPTVVVNSAPSFVYDFTF